MTTMLRSTGARCAASKRATALMWTTTVMWTVAVVLATTLGLAGCGGGGDGGSATPLPTALALSAPASQADLGEAVAFGSNAVAEDGAFRYDWSFGDGSTSNEAAPTHAYAKPGVYTVRLSVANGSGASVSTQATVGVADLALVKGKACSGAGRTGWCWQRPLPQGNPIRDYAFTDETHGWAVGDAGTLLATRDGGLTWAVQASGTESDLSRVAFADNLAGWVSAGNGELLRTADAGATWQRLSSGLPGPVRTLGAKDANTAWVTADSGNAHVTLDGGSTWKVVANPIGSYAPMWAFSATDFWAAGYFVDTPLRHSVDGGASWRNVALPALSPGLSGNVGELHFTDADHGAIVVQEWGIEATFYVSRQVVFATADGGTSWRRYAALPELFFSSIRRVQVIDARTVYVFPYYGAPLRTTDAGASWQALPLPSSFAPFYLEVRAFSAQRLIAFDSTGRAAITADGGASWVERSASGRAPERLASVWFFDPREGLAIGTDGSSVRSTDGGQTWLKTEPPGFAGWRRAQFLESGAGWVISDYGTLYLSFDRGRSWLAPVRPPATALYNIVDFHFIDARRGWAVLPFASSGAAIYSSADGGQSWQPVPGTGDLSGMLSIRFADATTGVAVGPAGIARVSTDAGATWSPRPTGSPNSLRRVTFTDATTAVAVGDRGAIVRSVDKGQTWSRIASPTVNDLNDVRFVSATVGHAVGAEGTVLATHDGGLSWAVQASGTRTNLFSVYFVDAQTGWVAGENGSVLVTVSGGR